MYRIKIATRAKLHSQIQTRFFDLRLVRPSISSDIPAKRAIASVSSASITVKSPKRLHTYARAKNSTEQRNEQRVYRTSEIVRARNFSLPRVCPWADHSFFNLCLPYFVFFTLRFRLHCFVCPDLKLHSRQSVRRNRPSRN